MQVSGLLSLSALSSFNPYVILFHMFQAKETAVQRLWSGVGIRFAFLKIRKKTSVAETW